MKRLLILAMAFAGCASNNVKLPPGSYAEGSADYSKDSGVHAGVKVHIPLGITGFKK